MLEDAKLRRIQESRQAVLQVNQSGPGFESQYVELYEHFWAVHHGRRYRFSVETFLKKAANHADLLRLDIAPQRLSGQSSRPDDARKKRDKDQQLHISNFDCDIEVLCIGSRLRKQPRPIRFRHARLRNSQRPIQREALLLRQICTVTGGKRAL